MEWILWFALNGTESAQLIAVYEGKEACERASKTLGSQIDSAVFECWEQPKGTYEKWFKNE